MIYIDSKMPECCDQCFAFYYSANRPKCGISKEVSSYDFPVNRMRMPHCPLMEQEVQPQNQEKMPILKPHKEYGDLYQLYENRFHCPTCDAQLINHPNYCPHCGQRLAAAYIWKGEEE